MEKMIRIDGIVTAVMLSPDARNNVYTVVGDKILNAKSELTLDVGDRIACGCRIEDSRAELKEIEVLGEATGKEIEGAIAKLAGLVDTRANMDRVIEAEKDKPYLATLKRMAGQIAKAASDFSTAYLAGDPIVVRFHNDGDGVSGAVSLYRALAKLQQSLVIGERGVSWVMQRGIEYDSESAYADIFEFNHYNSVRRPLVLTTDFGTAPGSEGAIIGSKAKYDMIMLDHHPPYDSFPKSYTMHYINTWENGGDSNFTAGVLCSLFAESISDIHTEDMKRASLISDYSAFADRTDAEGQRLAIVLDYLTSIAGRRDSTIDKLTPAYVQSLIMDKKKFEAAFRYSYDTLMDLLEIGAKSAKRYQSSRNMAVFVLDFEQLPRAESGYPLPGRYSSRLQEKLEVANGERTLLIVHYGSYITIRLSRAISKETGLLKIISGIVESSEYAESGGGHNEAASIKVDKDNAKSVLNLLLRELGCLSHS
ncbi:hypothetical protein M1397_00735 [Candidatus Marsarchaeota archaeon]|nr:hypothetical protein [Candidatus Marsarchaeota archaeon]